MEKSKLRQLAEGLGIDAPALNRAQSVMERVRSIEARELDSSADDDSDDPLWSDAGFADAIARRNLRVEGYAQLRGIPEAMARGLLTCRSTIESFKWRIGEGLGCETVAEAQARCAEIEAACRAGRDDEIKLSDARIANAWRWLSRAEEYFDSGDYLLVIQMVAHAGFTSFLAMDMLQWEVESERGRAPAEARWARLDPVKEWAFQQRRDDPPPRSRAAVIKRILPEVKERARAAGEPLTGDDPAVTRTISGWFRDAGIK